MLINNNFQNHIVNEKIKRAIKNINSTIEIILHQTTLNTNHFSRPHAEIERTR